MVMGEEEEEEGDEEMEAVWEGEMERDRCGRRKREREGGRECAVREGETIMSGAREGERNKKRGRRW